MTIINNTCSDNKRGLYLEYSSSSIVSNNTCSNNYWSGMVLTNSDNSTVVNNTCSNSSEGDGIYIFYSDNSTIANNTYKNNDRGINFCSSDFCVITYNLLQENGEYGVYLDSRSYNNSIHHNTFVDNNLGGTSQAYDSGANNTWYDSVALEGNFWSDHIGSGTYSIDGSTGAIDLYPLAEPTLPPIIAEYHSHSLFALLTLVFPLLLTINIYRKRRKIA